MLYYAYSPNQSRPDQSVSLGLSMGVARGSNFFSLCKAGICAASCGGEEIQLTNKLLDVFFREGCLLILHARKTHRLPSALLEGGCMYSPKPSRILEYYDVPKLV